MNPLKELARYGQAPWLDFFEHALLQGELERLIDEDGLKGLTSNPTIFREALTQSDDYAVTVRSEAKRAASPKELYERLAVRELQAAADQFRPLFEESNGWDGWVSLEVDPRLAYDTAGTVSEAMRLSSALDRPNAFIKVPATHEGLSAIEQLTIQGVPVNVTLLFGIPRYLEVADAYLRGLEQRLERGADLRAVHSVASFFLSRIDTLLDPRLEALAKRGGDHGELARKLYGEVALASARLAYRAYRRLVASDRWQSLARRGALPQWLLWGSTGTKNPQFDELKYVEPLIGAETISTMPPQTLEAFRKRGKPATRLGEGVDHAAEVMQQLAAIGIDIDEVTQQLETEGVEKFEKAFGELLHELERVLQAA